MAAFFNLILFCLLEPILADQLLSLGIEEEKLGNYFTVMPITYAVVSIFVDHFLLKRMAKRICLILGFFIFVLGFGLTGPS